VLKTEGDLVASDFYGRALVQVFAGTEHYQQYAVAMGWTPYYEKYGYSEEYHESFVEAENKARRDKLGVWSTAMQNRGPKGRPYDLLKQWWHMRAEQVKLAREFKKQGKNLSILANGEDYMKAFEQAQKNEEGQVFGEIARPSGKDQSGRGLFLLQVKMDVPFYLYVQDSAKQRDAIISHIETNFLSSLKNLPASLLKPNFIFVRGRFSLYSHYGHQIPEILVNHMDQISTKPQ
jgi:micrococcal nuclease